MKSLSDPRRLMRRLRRSAGQVGYAAGLYQGGRRGAGHQIGAELQPGLAGWARLRLCKKMCGKLTLILANIPHIVSPEQHLVPISSDRAVSIPRDLGQRGFVLRMVFVLVGVWGLQGASPLKRGIRSRPEGSRSPILSSGT